jgi:hypothetical protein
MSSPLECQVFEARHQMMLLLLLLMMMMMMMNPN